jgi:hypothetical protein
VQVAELLRGEGRQLDLREWREVLVPEDLADVEDLRLGKSCSFSFGKMMFTHASRVPDWRVRLNACEFHRMFLTGSSL